MSVKNKEMFCNSRDTGGMYEDDAGGVPHLSIFLPVCLAFLGGQYKTYNDYSNSGQNREKNIAEPYHVRRAQLRSAHVTYHELFNHLTCRFKSCF
jgi:hypothetical protein